MPIQASDGESEEIVITSIALGDDPEFACDECGSDAIHRCERCYEPMAKVDSSDGIIYMCWCCNLEGEVCQHPWPDW